MQERAELELLLMDESALRDAARGAGGGRGAKSLVLPKDDDADTSKMTKKVGRRCMSNSLSPSLVTFSGLCDVQKQRMYCVLPV